MLPLPLLRSWHLFALPGCLLLAGGCGSGEAPASTGELRDADARAAEGVAPQPAAPVRPGIDVLLADSLHLVEGRRVGFVTNHTALDAEGVHAIDRLAGHPGVELVALYSPEHGIRGDAEAGVLVDSSMDEATGLPVHSLYGATRKPTPEMLDGVEVLLFDIQDVGTRYYTYVYTMALAMEAAGEAGIPFVVLDRPNPVGGEAVQGNVLDPAFASFVGMYPLPMRHGMTPGELARLYQGAFGVEAALHLVPAEGWQRSMLFPETGLPWRAPSPNMPDLESALHYPGTCLFEGTNLSVGRGTDRAFQQVGAPWIEGEALAAAMTARVQAGELAGVRFEPVRFTPRNPGDGKFGDTEVEGVRLVVTDPGAYDPARAGVLLVHEAREQARALARGMDGAPASSDPWEWVATHFDRLAGTDRIRLGIEAGVDPLELMTSWDAELAAFEALRAPHLVYR